MAFGKEACDLAFRRSMLRKCRDDSFGPVIGTSNGVDILGAVQFVRCAAVAELFYLGVAKTKFGDDAFAKSQVRQTALLKTCLLSSVRDSEDVVDVRDCTFLPRRGLCLRDVITALPLTACGLLPRSARHQQGVSERLPKQLV